MNMKKWFAGCFVSALAITGLLVTGLLVLDTNAQTLSDSIARDVTPWYSEDQSSYPSQNDRRGSIVRTYRFDVHGGAVGDINVGAALPDGIMIIGGVIDVHAAMLPTNGTCGVEIGTADILATGSTLETTGAKAIVPVWTVGSSVITANSTSKMIVDVAGTAYTSGVFTVVLDVIQLNP